MFKIDQKKLIKHIREKRGDQSIRQASMDIGIGHSSLHRIESGTKPGMDAFIKISKWLEIPMESFITEK